MSKGTANLSGNTYLNVTTDKGKEALKALGTGKIVSDNDIFPNTEDVFWTVEKQAVLDRERPRDSLVEPGVRDGPLSGGNVHDGYRSCHSG